MIGILDGNTSATSINMRTLYSRHTHLEKIVAMIGSQRCRSPSMFGVTQRLTCRAVCSYYRLTRCYLQRIVPRCKPTSDSDILSPFPQDFLPAQTYRP